MQAKVAAKHRALLFLVILGASISLSLVLLRFDEQLTRAGSFGYIGAFGLAFTGNALVAVPFPWIFPVAAMGTVYPIQWVVLVGALGAACGEVIPYALGVGVARLGRPSKVLNFLESLSGIKKTVIVLGLAFSPVLSYPGLLAGVFRYPVWVTFAITLAAEGVKIWMFTQGVHLARHGWL